MNQNSLRIYRESRRAQVTASTAYRIATQNEHVRAYAFGAYPSDGDTIERDGIVYKLEIKPDDIDIADMLLDAVRYSDGCDLPTGCRILSEADRNTYGWYYTAETWAEFWPSETVPTARDWLFDHYVSNLRDLFEYGTVWVRIVATDAETDEELADKSIGGFDDAAYGAEEVFLQCESAAIRERAESADYVGRL